MSVSIQKIPAGPSGRAQRIFARSLASSLFASNNRNRITLLSSKYVAKQKARGPCGDPGLAGERTKKSPLASSFGPDRARARLPLAFRRQSCSRLQSRIVHFKFPHHRTHAK